MSRILAICTLTAMLLQGCSSTTRQNVANAAMLSDGMSKQQVSAVMGLPIKSEFSGSLEEWHYCNTGSNADEFVVLFFADGNLFSTRNYTVTLADTRGAYGDCSLFLKMGNYREPDVVGEFRNR